MREMTPCVRERIGRIADELLGSDWSRFGAGVEAILNQSAEEVVELCAVIRGLSARIDPRDMALCDVQILCTLQQVCEAQFTDVAATRSLCGSVMRLVGGDGEDDR